jgi:lipopolysaccharide export system permease protein
MIGWTLGRYIFFRYLSAVGAFLVGLAALIFIVDFSQLNERAGSLPQFTLATGLQVSAARVPMVLIQVIPFVALFGSMAMLIQLNRKYELVVARAAGLSAWQFLLPACAGAFVFGCATVAVLNPLAARGFAFAESFEIQWKTTRSAATSALKDPWLRQSVDGQDYIIGTKNVLKSGSALVNPVFLKIGKDEGIESRLDAETASLEPLVWKLTNVVLSRRGVEPESFKEYSVATDLTPELVQERLQLPETIPYYDLPKKIAVARALGVTGNGLEMQLQSILALPALVTVMTLIAATVSLKFVRFGQSAGMVLGGVLAGFVLYVISVLVKAFGSSGLVPPYLAAWFPVAVAFLFGVAFLLHREDG